MEPNTQTLFNIFAQFQDSFEKDPKGTIEDLNLLHNKLPFDLFQKYEKQFRSNLIETGIMVDMSSHVEEISAQQLIDTFQREAKKNIGSCKYIEVYFARRIKESGEKIDKKYNEPARVIRIKSQHNFGETLNWFNLWGILKEYSYSEAIQGFTNLMKHGFGKKQEDLNNSIYIPLKDKKGGKVRFLYINPMSGDISMHISKPNSVGGRITDTLFSNYGVVVSGPIPEQLKLL